MTPASGRRRGPAPPVRVLGRMVDVAITRFPRSWPLLRGLVRKFFDSQATRWDEHASPDPVGYTRPLLVALDHLDGSPGRILDVGTGTGAAAFELAGRHPDSEVVGIDVSARMIARARARAADPAGRLRFLVADIADYEDDEGFDLIAMLNMPPFFDRVVALLRPGGVVLNASSYGPRTPFFTSTGVLRREFERRGLSTVAAGGAASGTYYLARLG
jgi:SAM-dependent methyltransferase